LFTRIFLLNAAVLSVATLLLLLGPITVSTPALFTEALILVLGLAVLLVTNAVLLRLGLGPLKRLARTMSTTDLLRPAPAVAVEGHGEIADLIETFNSMLARLASERGSSAASALSAQEAERRRVAQELHDEVGQSLTAVLLELKRVADTLPPASATQLQQAQETTRGTLDEIRRIARRLRPGVLEELGLVSALKALTNEVTEHTGLTVQHRLASDLPELDAETELVVYRVAQESLTNTARHAHARQVELLLRSAPGGMELRLRDDGRGIGSAADGAGITGMRERALLIGAHLSVEPAPDAGTEVRLQIPLPRAERGATQA
jgi:two-component system sensor histidine kinase UhpB